MVWIVAILHNKFKDGAAGKGARAKIRFIDVVGDI